MKLTTMLAWVSLFLGIASAMTTSAQGLSEQIGAQLGQCRGVLERVSGPDFINTERDSVLQNAKSIEADLQAKRPLVALEALSSLCTSAKALSVAGEGWGEKGKGMTELEKEWSDAGKLLDLEKGKFPAKVPPEQPAFVRAVAEVALGQVNEHYAAALAYGQQVGPASGAYYLGRSLGSASFAVFAASLKPASGSGRAMVLPAMTDAVEAMDEQVVKAYAKPGSTKFHANFIVANSSVKLARELDREGYRYGALIVILRAAYALGQTELGAVSEQELPRLRQTADDWAKRLQQQTGDTSIPQQYLQKANVALDAGTAAGDAGNQQRQRAVLLLSVVLPKYFEIVEGKK